MPVLTPAPDAPDTDFDGYIILFLVGGEGPGIWRVVADPDAICEECGEDAPGRKYRTVALSHEYDPELGICQAHLQRSWDERTDPRAAPDPTGAHAHMYPPRPASDRPRG